METCEKCFKDDIQPSIIAKIKSHNRCWKCHETEKDFAISDGHVKKVKGTEKKHYTEILEIKYEMKPILARPNSKIP